MVLPVITVENIAKRYRLGAACSTEPTLADAVSQRIAQLRARVSGGVKPAPREDFWALKDVSFTVQAGEVLGIIGSNGAGKSTLLKILSRVTEPTRGRAVMRGRVASLLEVGTGFHPELTGRENIYLNGAILGMKRRRIRERFDEIVAFSEVETFLDTPIKRYSSGMRVRLAFAVAAHLEPEILIIDEVLAVGDVAFQRKCLGTMSAVGRSGRTVLFVSHNVGAVQRLCRRAVLLDHGSVVREGAAGQVVEEYLRQTRSAGAATYQAPCGSDADRMRLDCAGIADDQGDARAQLRFGEPFVVRMRWRQPEAIADLCYAVRIEDARGNTVTAANSLGFAQSPAGTAGCHDVACRFSPNVLVPGEYWMSIGAFVHPHTTAALTENCLRFTVSDVPFDAGHPYTLSGTPTFAIRPEWSDYTRHECAA